MAILQVPKIQFFKTLLKNNCIHAEKISVDEAIYWVLMPGSGAVVPLREQCHQAFDAYTFLVDNPTLVTECLNANVVALDQINCVKYCPIL